MLALLQADIVKIRSFRLFWILAIICFLLVSIFLIGIRIWVSPEEAVSESWTIWFFTGPRFIGQTLGGLMLVVFGASLPGMEYANDTWKNLFVRYPHRDYLILSKWITMLICVTGALFCFALDSMILASIFGLSHFQMPYKPSMPIMLLSLVLQVVILMSIGGIALLGTVIWRSTLGGIILGFCWLVLDSSLGLIPHLPDAIRYALFHTHALNISQHLRILPEDIPTFALWPSIWFIAFYFIAPLFLAIVIFRQRDMIGSQ